MKAICCVALISTLVAASTADARYYGSSRRYQGYGSNTMGDLIRAQGQYELLHQQALLQNMEVQRQAMQNRVQSMQTYLQLRELNKQVVESINPTRDKYAAPTPPRATPVKRLSASQLDPVTGDITWAPALAGDEFAPYRQQIQTLFTARAHHVGGVGTTADAEIRRAADDMEAELHRRIDSYKPQEYVDARHFIEALAYEARYPEVAGH